MKNKQNRISYYDDLHDLHRLSGIIRVAKCRSLQKTKRVPGIFEVFRVAAPSIIQKADSLRSKIFNYSQTSKDRRTHPDGFSIIT
jgi:hypothetical protein